MLVLWGGGRKKQELAKMGGSEVFKNKWGGGGGEFKWVWVEVIL